MLDNLTENGYNHCEVIFLEVKFSSESPADEERNLKVYKSDDLIQKARYSLSITEQRFLLYSISKIKQDDDAGNFYDIRLSDFQKVCGTDADESYSHVKAWIKRLADKSWWMQERRSESLVRWFSSVKLFPGSDLIQVKFHEEMFPYLFRLAEQMRDNGRFYTGYTFRYVLPMKSTYSVRLYELIKSYQKNNVKWMFKLDDLRKLLDCQCYNRFPDFRRYALQPAVKEINLYTDIKLDYVLVKDKRKVTAIEFTITEKEFKEIVQAHHIGLTELDGNVHYWDVLSSGSQAE
jgi:plasmid replication initiation protein